MSDFKVETAEDLCKICEMRSNCVARPHGYGWFLRDIIVESCKGYRSIQESPLTPTEQLRRIHDILNDGPWAKRLENAQEVLSDIARTFPDNPVKRLEQYEADLDYALKFWNEVQKGCKKCGASVAGSMTFPKGGGGPLCKVCAEKTRE